MFGLRSARGRAILAAMVLVVLVVGMGALAAWRARDDERLHDTLDHTAAAATALEGAQAGFWQAQGALSALVISGDPALVEDYDHAFAAAEQNLTEARAEFLAMGQTAEVSAVDDLTRWIGQFNQQVRPLFSVLIEGERQAVIQLASASIAGMMVETKATITDLEGMVREAQRDASAEREAGNRAADLTLWLLLGLGGVALAAGIGTVLMLVGSVVGPLAALRASASAIASGDSEARARVFGPEEVASLARDFNEMTDALAAKTEAAQESERRYRLLAENATDVIWTRDLNLRPTYISPSVTGILGYSVEEAMAQTPEEVMTPASVEAAMKAVVEELAIEQQGLSWSRTLELEHYCKDGSTVWLEVTTAFLRDEDGRPVGILGASRNITERKRAEEALRESEERFRRLADASLEGIAISDKGKIVDANAALAKMFGREPSELVGMLASDLVAPESRELVMQRALSGDEHPYEAVGLRKDGATFWIEVCGKALSFSGRLLRVTAVRDISERKRAEDALRESEEKYRELVENINEIIYKLDSNGVITYISPVVEQLAGYTPSEVIGRPFTEFVHPDDISPLMQSFQETFAGNLNAFEYRVLTKSGEAHWVRTSSRPVLEGDRIVGFHAVLTDITERKRAEETLRESESKYRTLVENIPQKVFFKDRNSVYVSCNENYARDLRINADQIAGKTDYDFYPRELADKYRADDKRVMQSGETEDIEEEYVQDGRQSFIHTVKTPVKAEDGSVVGVLGVFRDITERKRAEEAVLRAKEEWERTFDAVPDLIAIIDEHYHIVRANRAMAERLGLTPDECVGKVCYEVVHGLDYPPQFCPHTPSLADGRDHAAEVNEPRLGGEFLVSVTPLADEQGRRVGSVHVARDITDRKRAEEELRRRNEELRLFLDLSRALASSMEMDKLVETALEGVGKVLPQADVISVGIYNRDKDVLETRSARGKHRNAQLRMAVKPGEGITGKVFKLGKSVLYSSPEEVAAAREDMNPANLRLLLQVDPNETLLQSAICSPLVAEGRALGSLLVVTSDADAPFQPADLVLLEAAASHIAVALDKAQLHAELEVRAITDGLTGLYSHAHFFQRLSEETERSGRYNHGFAVAMMDVDNFKKFNDSRGHQEGDKMLRLVADSIRSGLRRSDLAFRYGGDEFAAIMLRADAARARTVIDRINRHLARNLKQMNDESASRVSLSAGVACFGDDGRTAGELVRVADAALYSAKWAARTRHAAGEEYAIQSLAAPPEASEMGLPSNTVASLAAALRELGVPDALAELNLRTIAALGTVAEVRDPYIRGHQERTSEVAASVAQEMGLSSHRVRGTRLAGLLHDLGKAGISRRILNKPGKLTEEEFAEIKEHPPLGSMMIISEIEALQQVVPIVRHHHEHFDGKGYPDGLAGEEIPIEARILTVVDAFDAMIHERSYRKALSREEALAELERGAGTQFDPAVVEAFLTWAAEQDEKPVAVPTTTT